MYYAEIKDVRKKIINNKKNTKNKIKIKNILCGDKGRKKKKLSIK